MWREFYRRDVGDLLPHILKDLKMADTDGGSEGGTWLEAYKAAAAFPRWDSTYTDKALLISKEGTFFQRDHGRGLFPRAFATVFLPPGSVRWVYVHCRNGTTEVHFIFFYFVFVFVIFF